MIWAPLRSLKLNVKLSVKLNLKLFNQPRLAER
nr:MAG TPA: hypothetical protein [Caudoviricetes sp.]